MICIQCSMFTSAHYDLWLFIFIQMDIFQSNSLVCVFQSNLNIIEIYSYSKFGIRDLFLWFFWLFQMPKEMENLLVVTTLKWDGKLRPQKREPFKSINIHVRRVLYFIHSYIEKNEICLYYGIVCHINKLQIFPFICTSFEWGFWKDEKGPPKIFYFIAFSFHVVWISWSWTYFAYWFMHSIVVCCVRQCKFDYFMVNGTHWKI